MNKDDIYHTYKLREHRRMNKSGVFFVTKCLNRTLQIQTNLTTSLNKNNCCADIITKTFCHIVETDKIKLAAFIVMPDHWHALFGVGAEYLDNVRTIFSPQTNDISRQTSKLVSNATTNLPNIMKSITNWVSKQYNKQSENKLNWQPGYYETRIRNNKQFSYICNYIELNPLRQQLIKEKKLWQWSSANENFKQYLTRPWPWKFENEISM